MASVPGGNPERSRWPAAMLLSTAAEYLDTSTTSVEKLIKNGEFGAVQFNERGDRRVLREEIDAFLARIRDERVSA